MKHNFDSLGVFGPLWGFTFAFILVASTIVGILLYSVIANSNGNVFAQGSVSEIAISLAQNQSTTVNEGVGEVMFAVSVTPPVSEDISVGWVIEGCTAGVNPGVTPNDVDSCTGSVDIPAHGTVAFSVLVTDDVLVEGDEELRLSLISSGDGASSAYDLSLSMATVTVEDNDTAYFSFLDEAVRAREGDELVSIGIISNPLDVPIRFVTIVLCGDTGIGDWDELFFCAGDTERRDYTITSGNLDLTLNYFPVYDEETEDEETFQITLADPDDYTDIDYSIGVDPELGNDIRRNIVFDADDGGTVIVRDPNICDEAQIFDTASGIPLSECQTLLDIYESSNGPEWVNNEGWLSIDTDIGMWYGVTVEVVDGAPHVTELALGDNGLIGSVPSIGDLTNLVELDLSANDLSLPVQISELKNLKILDFHLNGASWQIPPELGNLLELEELNLARSSLIGEIPSSIFNLVNLKILNLSGNLQLSGEISHSIGNMTDLRVLNLGSIQLSSAIPPSIGNLVKLDLLALDNIAPGRLTGLMPYHICRKVDALPTGQFVLRLDDHLEHCPERDRTAEFIPDWAIEGVEPVDGAYTLNRLQVPIVITAGTGTASVHTARIMVDVVSDSVNSEIVTTVTATADSFTGAPTEAWSTSIPNLPPGSYRIDVRQALYPDPAAPEIYNLVSQPKASDNVLSIVPFAPFISVQDALTTINENPPINTVTFAVNLPENFTHTQDISVDWSVNCTEPDSGITAADFASGSCPSGTVTIAASASSGVFTVTALDDVELEGVETFEVRLTNVRMSGLDMSLLGEDSSIRISIIDNDDASLSIETLSGSFVPEGGSFEFIVRLSGTSIGDIILPWRIDCSSSSGSDFAGGECPSGVVTIAANTSSAGVVIHAASDNLLESDEVFRLVLPSVGREVPEGFLLSPLEVFSDEVSILDVAAEDIIVPPIEGEPGTDNDAASLSIETHSVSSVPEGESLEFIVRLSGTSMGDIILPWRIDCSSSSGSDFVGGECPTGIVTIAAGTLTVGVVIRTASDVFLESDEVFRLVLPSVGREVPEGFQLSPPEVFSDEVSIVDTTAGYIVVSPLSDSVLEGSSAEFLIRRVGGTLTENPTISVDWAVVCGVSASADDFAGGECPSGTVTIDASASSGVFTVSVFDDMELEEIETFDVRVIGVRLPDLDLSLLGGSSSIRISIIDNDAASLSIETLSVSSVPEGGSFEFIIRLSGTSIGDIILPWRIDCSSSSGSDFVGGECPTGIVTIAAGTLTAGVVIRTASDVFLESDEVFRLVLPSVGREVPEGFQLSPPEVFSDEVSIVDTTAGYIVVSSLADSVLEGSSAEFLIHRVGGTLTENPTISVDWAVVCGVSASADDFAGGECPSGTITIDASASSGVFTVSVFDDMEVEELETFDVRVIGVRLPDLDLSLLGGSSSIRISIIDNDAASLSIETLSVSSVPEGESLEFIVRLSGTSIGDIILPWRVDCSSSSGSDFVGGECPSGIVTIAAGTLTAGVVIRTASDVFLESDEVFRLVLPSGGREVPEGFQLSPPEVFSDEVSIVDTTAGYIVVSPLADSVLEGSSAEFLIRRVGGTLTENPTISVDWAVVCGVSASADDFAGGECPSGTVTIDASASSGVFTVSVFDDMEVEELETFDVRVIGVRLPDLDLSLLGGSSSIRISIIDNDAASLSIETLSVSSVPEGGSFEFIVRLSDASTDDIVLPWLVDCSSSSGSDFAGGECPSGVVTIAANTSSAGVVIYAASDNLLEGEEMFRLLLLPDGREFPEGFVLSTSAVSSAEVTISDTTSGIVGLSGLSSSVSEGASVEFRVYLEDGVVAEDSDISVDWAVICDGAVSASDFEGSVCPSGTATIAASASVGTFTVSVLEDVEVEGVETFTVSITTVGASGLSVSLLGGGTSISVSITDNDVATLSIETLSSSSVPEGGSLDFIVRLSDASMGDIVLPWRVDCSSSSGSDFAGGECPSGVVTIAANTSTAGVVIYAASDNLLEGDEVFRLLLPSVGREFPEGFVLSTSAVSSEEVTISDTTSGIVGLSGLSSSVSEGTSVEFGVYLKGGIVAENKDISVDWVVACNSSVSANDFAGEACPSGTVTIAASGSSGTFTVSVLEDVEVEGVETFEVRLTAVRVPGLDMVSVSDTSGVMEVSITDNDIASLSIETLSVSSVPEAGSLEFIVRSSDASMGDIVLPWRVDCSSSSSSDFAEEECPSGVVTIAANTSTAGVVIYAASDNLLEGEEMFRLLLPSVGREFPEGFVLSTSAVSSEEVIISDTTSGIVGLSGLLSSVSEGASVEFGVYLEGGIVAEEKDISVDWAVACNSSVSANDFAGEACPSGTATIAASASVGTFTVSVLEDVEVEGVETFTVSITTVGASGLSVSLLGSGTSISVSITDNDAATLSIETHSVSSVPEGGSLDFIVRLSDASMGDIVLPWRIDCSSSSGSDFAEEECPSGVVTIAANTLSAGVVIYAASDNLLEGEEMFRLLLPSVGREFPEGFVLSTSAVSSEDVTISDTTSGIVGLSGLSSSVSEGASVEFRVYLEGGIVAENKDISVDWAVACNSSVLANDFAGEACPSGTATISASGSSGTFTVSVLEDVEVEGVETFTVSITTIGASGLSVSLLGGGTSISVSITDNDIASLSVEAPLGSSVPEGESLEFIVRLSDASTDDIVLPWRIDCSSSSGSDFAGGECPSGVVTIAANTLSAGVVIYAASDNLLEGEEMFRLLLPSVGREFPEGFVLSTSAVSSEEVTISDTTSGIVELSGLSSSVSEGASVEFRVYLEGGIVAEEKDISVDWAVVCDGTVSANDFEDGMCPSGTATIAASGSVGTFTVSVLEDVEVEGVENFTVSITTVGASGLSVSLLGGGTSISVSITDNDVASLSIETLSSSSVPEGGSFEFIVRLSDASMGDIVLPWRLNCSSSSSGSDFAGGECPSGVVTIAANTSTAGVVIYAASDNLLEGDEVFRLVLPSVGREVPEGFVLSTSAVSSEEVTISDTTSGIVGLSGLSSSVSEGTSVEFRVYLEDGVVAEDSDISVDWAVICDGSVSVNDFEGGMCPSGTATIAASGSSGTFTVSVLEDVEVEGVETFTVSITTVGASGLSVSLLGGGTSISVSITDNDAATLSIETLSSSSVPEGGSLDFIVRLSDASMGDIVLPWRIDCSSSSGSDFAGGECPSGVVTIAANTSSVGVVIYTASDNLLEGDEMFRLLLPSVGREFPEDFVLSTSAVSSEEVIISDTTSGIVGLSGLSSSVSEGTSVEFRVYLEDGVVAEDSDISVDWAVICDGSVSANDFEGGMCPSGTATIAASASVGTFTVSVLEDVEVEGVETFTVSITTIGASGLSVSLLGGGTSISVSITDNDIASLSVEAPLGSSVPEGESLEFIVRLSDASTDDIVLPWRIDCSSSSGSDFAGGECPSGVVTIAANTLSAGVVIYAASDNLLEGEEMFRLLLPSVGREFPEGFVLSTSAVSSEEVTISDTTSGIVELSGLSSSVSEGASVEFRVYLEGGIVAEDSDISVDWAVICDASVSASDFEGSVCPSGTVTIAASGSSGTFTVSVLEDVEVEGVETFTVSITTVGASGLSVSLLGGGSSISVLITDNDVASLSIETLSSSSVPEGGSFEFIVRLSDASTDDIVLPWRIDCSSSSGSDFAGGECPSGVVTIAANTLSAGVVIYAASDNLLEGEEMFRLLLPSVGREFPEGFVLSTSAVSSEEVTISDTTSGIVELSGLSSSVSEGASVEFRVYLEGGIVAEDSDISVDWAVICDASVSASDFEGSVCPSGTVTIAASGSSGTFTVSVLEDVEVEGVETFTVSITTVGASGLSVSLLGGGSSISVLITDNDVASLSIETLSSSSVPEGGSFEFIVRLSDASTDDIVLPWRIDCSSSSGSDFAGGECPSGVVTIAANTLSASVMIYTASDTLLEGEEMFRLLLPSVGREFPEGFVLSTSAVFSEEVIISDTTSGIVGLSGLSSSVSEGVSVEFRVYLEGGIVAEDKDISVDWAVACNSSVSANDFAGEACPSGTVTISASASVGTFTVSVLEDVEVEGVETFTVSITTVGASGLSVSLLGSGTSISVSITDNDAATLSIETLSSSSVPEGGSLEFIVRLSDASMGDIVLPWRIDCSSSSGSDFAGGECPSGVVTIAANTLSAGVVIYAASDNLLEGDEVFHLLLPSVGREVPEGFVLSTSAVSSEEVIISDTTSGIVELSGLLSSVSEGVSVEFRVYLEGGIVAEDKDISVDWAVACNSSVSANDFAGEACPSGTVTISASASVGTFTVSVLEDVEVEGVETFTVSITTVGASGLSVSLLGSGTSISVSITDNDAATLSIETLSSSSVPEGGSLEFIVRLSDASMGDIVLPWRIDCSSSSGSDFAGGECPSGVVTIAANTLSAGVVIYAASDNLLEGDEVFHLLLPSVGREVPEGFVLSTSAVSSEEVIISDTTSGIVELSGLLSSVSEGTSVEFRVYLEGGIVAEDKDISVDWAVACNSSVSANDFAGETCPSGTATIAASASVGTFTVSVLEDVEVEGVENFTVSITTVGASGLSVSLLGGGSSISVSITDNDAATLSIETLSSSSVPEGGSFEFIVRSSDASIGDIVLPWRIDCSSSSGSDFAEEECPSGVVTIAANTLSAGVVIYAASDNLLEGDEVFHLLLPSVGREVPEGFVLSTSAVSSEEVIISDTTSGIVELSGLLSSVSEGTSVEFRVYLEGGIVAEDKDISVDWAVACNSSVSANDFAGETCPSGTATIAASASVGTFTVSVLEDVEVEGVETFTVSITTVGASGLSVSLLGGGSSISVSITDNDAATLSIETLSSSSVPEGGSFEFIVRSSDASIGDIVLPWRIDCSSSSGSDFAEEECPSGVVTIAANTLSAGVVIYAASDNLLEGDEVFRLLLPSVGREFPEGFVLSTSAVSSGEVTISDTTSGLVGLSGLSSSVSEGASVEFGVYLEGGIVAENKDISVDWAVACNSSVSANDFAGEACPSGTATIAASASVGTFTVSVLEDVEVEGVETFTVSITTIGASGLSISLLGGGSSISVSITDNDAVTLSIETLSSSSVPEGGSLDFIVRLSDASMGDIVLPWRVDCSSSSGSDFAGGECPSGVVTIAANTSSAGVVIYAASDNLLEGDEVFHLLLPSVGREVPEGFVLSTSAVSSEEVIISDTTSGIVELSGLLSSVSEGTSVEFRVYLEGGIVAEDKDISVDWAVACNSSVSANDFAGETCPSGTATIAASASVGTFTVSVLEDVEVEGVETFTVSITTVGASGLSVSLLGGGSSISVSITDNDAATLSIETLSSSSVPEGGSFEFIVRSSDASIGDIVLPWRIDCSSSSGSDFAEEECPSGVVTIAANTLSAGVVIYAASDNLLEGDEVFRLLLPSVGREFPEGFVLSTSAVSSGEVTISDTTSGLVGLSGLSSSVSEGASVEFGVYLEGGIVAEDSDISVDWAVICDGSVSANDFEGSVCPSGTVTIAASASSGVFTVSVLEDVEVEGVETFTVSITTVGASGLSVSLLGGGTSISVSITDNDVASLSVETHSVSSVPEGGSLEFIVRLSDASTDDIVLPWRVDCSSSSGSDFAGGECPSGVVTIAANTSSVGVVIYTASDNLLEGDEVFRLLLPSVGREFPDGFVLPTSAVSSEEVTISDTTSGLVGLSGLSSSVSEGTSVEFGVYLEGGIVAENKDISVDWAVACNSSVSANDFAGEACPSGTVMIAASASSGVFTVSVLEDVEVEGVETFTVSITTVGASGLSVSLLGGGSSISVSITDNDVATLSIETHSSSSVPEGGSLEFIVRLSDASMGDIVLPWRIDCSSSSGSDFVGGECPSGVVTIAANTSSVGVVIYTASDNLLEGDEVFRLLLPSVGREFPEGFVLSTSAVSSEEVIISDTTSGLVGLSGLLNSVSEGASVEFGVYLEGGIVAENKDISVDWAVICDGSVSANDFAGSVCPSGTATIAASESVGTFTVSVLEDVEVERVETFTVSITTVGASGLSVSLLGGGTSISVSITDNDVASLSIETLSSSSVPEGESFEFIVRLSDASMDDIVLPWRIDCSSSSGSDFAEEECPSGVVTIAANTLSVGVVIYAASDNLLEGEEMFRLLLPSVGREFPEGFVLSTSAVSSEEVTISDTTSGLVGLSGLSSSVSEGTSVEFGVYLEGGVVAEEEDISVDWAVICDGTVSANDFEGGMCPSGTATISASGSSGTFTVSVLEDVEVEGVETFKVRLTAVRVPGLDMVSVSDTSGVMEVSITDNDVATLSIETHSSSSVPEGGSLEFIVRLSDASMGDIVLPWRIDCSSSSDSDFAGGECPSGVVTIAANTSSAGVVIYAASDNLLEGDEVFRLLLPSVGREFPEGFVLSTSAVSSEEVIISDTTSGLVGLSGLLNSVSEGASVEFGVYLEGGVVAEEEDISVDWAVICDGTVSANDFEGGMCPSGTATIAASESVGTFTVSVLEDVEVEGVETFKVRLTAVRVPGLDMVSVSDTSGVMEVSITDNDVATLSIETHSSSSVPEGGSLEFIVRLSDASMGDIVLPWRIDCSSSSDSDFAGGECPSGVVTIAANTSSAGVVIYAASDNLLEGDEVFRLLLPSVGREFPEGFVLSTSAVSSEEVIISDTTSGIVGLSGLSSSVSEGVSVEFGVYLEGGVVAEDSDISVDWAVICDGSVSANDFEGGMCPSGTVTIAASASVGTFTVSVLEDVEVEGVETFTVSITTIGASGLSVSLLGGGTSISVSITDNDAASLSIETLSVSSVPEGGSLEFIVRSSDASTDDIVLPWRLDCSSSSGSDFAGEECPSGVVTIAANTSSAGVVIYAASDNLLEGDEVFRLLLPSVGREVPEGFVLSTSAVSSEDVTISDTTSGIVGLSGLSSSVSEGASVEFRVYLEGGIVAEEEDISVDWAVICDGTVSANDFEGGMCPSGTVTIAASASSGVFTVTLSDDRDVEDVETFAVRLTAVRVSGLDMVSVSDTSGVMEVSIMDNDVASLSVETSSVSSALEGGSLEFIVRLSDASMGDIVLPWRIDCSSSSGSDFAEEECPSGVVTIAANTSTAGVVIYAASDNLLEGDEVFRLLLPSVGREFPEGFVLSTSAVSSEEVTISDTTSGLVGLSGLSSSVSEGTSVEFRVYLEGGVVAEDSDISVDWAVICDGSVSANDFVGSVCPSGTATIAAGESSGTFTVTLSDDRDVEDVETFAVRLTAVRVPGLDMVSVSDTSGVMEVSITDNDLASLSVETDSVSSALEGGSLEFIVRLSDASMGDIVLPWRLNCSSSSSGSDFAGGECPSGVVTIAANTSSAGVVIYVASDNLLEGEEMFRLLLPSVGREFPEGFVLSTSAVFSEEVTISDTTSGIVGLSGLSSSVSEGASVEFGVYLEGGVVAEDSDISVDWAVACNSSVSANDFAGGMCPSGTVTIAASASSGVFTVTLSDDRDVEDVETFEVRLTAVRVPGLDMVSVSDTSGVMEVSITDNDAATLSIETLSISSVSEGGSFEFIVRLSDASTDDIVLPWRIDCSSLSSGSDFAGGECPSGVVTIAANTSSAGVVIYAASDNLLEGEEMFRLLLPSVGRELPEGFVLSTSAVSSEEVIISDTTPGIVGLSGLSSSVSEDTSVEFRVYLEGGVVVEDKDISVDWAVVCDGNVSANDFAGSVCPSGTVTIAASASSGVFTVSVLKDVEVEGVETFTVGITTVGASGLSVSLLGGGSSISVSITDGNDAPTSSEEPSVDIELGDSAPSAPNVPAAVIPINAPTPRASRGGGGGGSSSVEEEDMEVIQPDIQPIMVLGVSFTPPQDRAVPEIFQGITFSFTPYEPPTVPTSGVELFTDSIVDISIIRSDADLESIGHPYFKGSRVCMTVTAENLAEIDDDTLSMMIYILNEDLGQWKGIGAVSYDDESHIICGTVDQLSVFALGYSEQSLLSFGDVGVLLLPPTGGWHPSLWMLLLAVYVGVVLLLFGIASVSKKRRC